MSDIAFVTISSAAELEKLSDPLRAFFDSLDGERRYFSYLNMDYIRRSDFVIAARDGSKIVGVAGVETTHLIAHKAYIGVHRDYQMGLGAFLSLKRNSEARKRYDWIILKIDKDNKASQDMNRVLGYKVLGRNNRDDYLAMPFNRRGWFLLRLIRPFMPVLHARSRLAAMLRRRPQASPRPS
jgi:hypothetical protein